MENAVDPSVQQLFDLTGRTALVTGASGYLGSAMSRALAEAGARVVVSSRDASRAQLVASKLPAVEKGGHVGVPLDQLVPATIDSGFAAAVAATGGVDILVNNGNSAVGDDLTTVGPEGFGHTLANATGYFLLARKLRDHVVERGVQGSIVQLGSMYGQVGSYPDAYEGICPASPVAYHALKGGIIHMTRHLAVYWAADGVRVNCLSPGPFPSDSVPPELPVRLAAKCPMGRMGKPYELKGAIVFLASDASSYMTGQNLTIDGGWTAW